MSFNKQRNYKHQNSFLTNIRSIVIESSDDGENTEDTQVVGNDYYVSFVNQYVD